MLNEYFLCQIDLALPLITEVLLTSDLVNAVDGLREHRADLIGLRIELEEGYQGRVSVQDRLDRLFPAMLDAVSAAKVSRQEGGDRPYLWDEASAIAQLEQILRRLRDRLNERGFI